MGEELGRALAFRSRPHSGPLPRVLPWSAAGCSFRTSSRRGVVFSDMTVTHGTVDGYLKPLFKGHDQSVGYALTEAQD